MPFVWEQSERLNNPNEDVFNVFRYELNASIKKNSLNDIIILKIAHIVIESIQVGKFLKILFWGSLRLEGSKHFAALYVFTIVSMPHSFQQYSIRTELNNRKGVSICARSEGF